MNYLPGKQLVIKPPNGRSWCATCVETTSQEHDLARDCQPAIEDRARKYIDKRDAVRAALVRR